MARLNKLLTGHQITDELVRRTSSALLPIGHDTFMSVGLVIRTAAGGGGSLLTLGTDYTLGSQDTSLSTQAGTPIYTRLSIVNGAYVNVNLYATYKSIGDFASVESCQAISKDYGIVESGGDDTNGRYLKYGDGTMEYYKMVSWYMPVGLGTCSTPHGLEFVGSVWNGNICLATSRPSNHWQYITRGSFVSGGNLVVVFQNDGIAQQMYVNFLARGRWK